jgi:hypothetical protein
MKIGNFIYTVALSGLALIGGCDSLNLDPRSELNSDAVWSDAALTEAYLNQIYSATGYGYGNPFPSAGIVDETIYTHSSDTDANLSSTLTPENRGQWSRTDNPNNSFEHLSWRNVYASIRDLNVFIQNVEAGTVLPDAQKSVFLGEAYFLRAFFYHNLLKMYGGVPIIDTVFELGGDLEQYQVPRNTFAETVDFIVADLDRAATRLTLSGRRPGAASQGAALALKSRVLLFAASDLYNLNPSGSELTGYTSGDQMQRWQAAQNAAQAVMDLGIYNLETATSSEAYHALIVRGSGTELIWARFFSGTGTDTHNHGLWVSPNGYNSWSGDTPLQNHVDAYEMADGSEFSWDNPTHAATPYQNRDPRFDANILYNGKTWRPRTGGAAGVDPVGVIQTGWYEVSGQSGLRPGLDTREGPIQNWNGTRSGYNMAKFLDRGLVPDAQQHFNPWIHIRYAEVLLNYAEASEELGQTGNALTALNEVRARVGMPDVPADGGDGRTVLDRIRKERQIELAFEGHRYFDVRRWMTAPEVYTGTNNGIRITGRLDPNGELLVTEKYRYEYQVVPLQNKSWNDRNYFVPIDRNEMERNPALIQNPGYN